MENNDSNNQWAKEIPTKEGFYWFYGYPFGREIDGDCRLIVVEVWDIPNGQTYIGLGTFLYPYSKEEPMNGYWMELLKPTTEGLKF